MTLTIIVLCSLLLFAYLFDISYTHTKIPSVILLLFLGWVVKVVLRNFEIQLFELQSLLAPLGTIGLILIVLEGSLEVELNTSKVPVIRKSLIMAISTMIILAAGIGFMFYNYENTSLRKAILNAIPFCVISSSVAISSVRNLPKAEKEFVVYESSMSDIFGVLLFNFILLNEVVEVLNVGKFVLQLLLMICISFLSVVGLSLLLSRIKHHVTYSPIILMTILIYFVSKLLHLPGLLFIVIFGLFLGNLDELRRFRWIEFFHPDRLDVEVAKFKDITYEATFVIRALFFMLFGFLLETKDIINIETLPWALGIAMSIMVTRYLALKILRLPAKPLLFIAPRGLITILLFLAILPPDSIPIVSDSLIIQTILITILIMMIGLVFSSKQSHIHPLPSGGQVNEN